MFSNRKIFLITILLITFAGVAYFLLVIMPRHAAQQTYDGARQLGKDIREVFNFTPTITVNNTVFIQQETPILELSTLSQKFHHTYVWSNTKLYSKKQIKIEGTFEAKVGFNLQDTILVDITDRKAVVTFPDPKVLSLESLQDVKFEDENGLINWINEEDRSDAINAFTRNARIAAENETFKHKAIILLQKELLPILRNHVDEVELRVGDTLLKKNFLIPGQDPTNTD